jgi:hypothetical protein
MNHVFPAAFFQWCVGTSLARAIANSMWGFAVLETFHILGSVLLLGAIVVLNFRVLGFGVRQPAPKLAREVAPWGLAGLGVMVLSGIPMFMSAANTYSGSTPFALKMVFLLCALSLQLVIHKAPGMYAQTATGKIAACLSLLCWFGVAYSGRAIAFEVLFDPFS